MRLLCVAFNFLDKVLDFGYSQVMSCQFADWGQSSRIGRGDGRPTLRIGDRT
jgi:hypothetical protein